MKLLYIAVVCLSICVVFSTTVSVTKVYEKDHGSNEFGGHENVTKTAADNKKKEYDTEKVTVSPYTWMTTTRVTAKTKEYDTEKVTVSPYKRMTTTRVTAKTKEKVTIIPKKTTTSRMAVDAKPKEYEANRHKAESNPGAAENTTPVATTHRN